MKTAHAVGALAAFVFVPVTAQARVPMPASPAAPHASRTASAASAASPATPAASHAGLATANAPIRAYSLASAPLRAFSMAPAAASRAGAAPGAHAPHAPPVPGTRAVGFVPDYVLQAIARNTAKSDPAMARAALASLRAPMVRLPSPWPGHRIWDPEHPTFGKLARETYDANFTSTIPKTPELTETDRETAVESAKLADHALKSFYDLNKSIGFDTMSIVAPGKALQIVVRYGHMDNAYYDGQKMVLGGGNPNGLFKDLSVAPDVTYHEVGHGMTEKVLTAGNEAVKASIDYRVSAGMLTQKQGADLYNVTLAERAARAARASTPGQEGVLEYHGESGALNESISDVYGAMGLQFDAGTKLGQLTEKDWLIGHDALNSSVQNDPGKLVALRNMLHPGTAYNDPRLGKDPQPADYTHINPNGEVHMNSGVGNRAFAEASMQLAKVMPDKGTWETTGKVWLHAMSLLGPNATYKEAAAATYATAKQFFPKNPEIADAVAYGWKAVAVDPNGPVPSRAATVSAPLRSK